MPARQDLHLAPMEALVVDDDPSVVAWITQLLSEDGWQVHVAESVRAALAMIGTIPIQVAIVDFELPDGRGTDAVQSLRMAVPEAAILMLSGYSDDDAVVNGLMSGADDFIHKPVSATVLRARIAAVLRRHTLPDRLTVGDLLLDRQSRRLAGVHGEVQLTAKEFQLLATLMSRPGEVLARATLLADVWGYDFDPGTSVLDVALSRIRQKVASVSAQSTIVSVRNVGVQITAN